MRREHTVIDANIALEATMGELSLSYVGTGEAFGATGGATAGTDGTAYFQHPRVNCPVYCRVTGGAVVVTPGTPYFHYPSVNCPVYCGTPGGTAVAETVAETVAKTAVAETAEAVAETAGTSIGATGRAAHRTSGSAYSPMSRRHVISGVAVADPTIPDDESTYFPEDKPDE